jgi:hypothetical protein
MSQKRKLIRFSSHEKNQLLAELRSANETTARLIKAFLDIIEEYEETRGRRELMKFNFLNAVMAFVNGRKFSEQMADELEMVAADLGDEKNPVASSVEALAVAIRARLRK